jgi:predicted ATPase
LVQVLKDHVAHERHVRWECRSAEYAQNTALFPLTDLFQRFLQFQAEDTSDKKLGKLEQMLSQYRLPLAESVPLFVPLLSLPIPDDRYPPLTLSPQHQRQKTLESIVAILLELAEQQPVLFILEDLHWTDPTTLELLGLLVEQVPTAAISTLLTCRPHFQPSWHHRSYITEMTLTHLSSAQAEQIVHRITDGKTLPPEVLQQILAKTDGVPLFIEEMTKAMLESGHLKEADEHYVLTGPFSTFTIPATLQDSLMARLDRLVTAKAVAQLAAVIGRQFAYELLSTVSQLDEVTLQRELRRLVEAELVYQRGVPPSATYSFKHALIQDAAAQSMLKSTRQQYHQRIAHVLEEQFPETAEAEPELLAQHYTEAGLREQAMAYWQRAGQRALQRSANLEAINHVTKGLEVLNTLPESREQAQHELTLQIMLGVAFAATRGQQAPETAATYARACALARQVGSTPALFPALLGYWYAHMAQGQLPRARELAEEFLELARQQHDALLLAAGHRARGNTAWWQGALHEAQVHCQQGLACYDPVQHHAAVMSYGQDAGVVCGWLRAATLWMRGYPDQALQAMQETLALARRLAHPFSMAQTLHFSAYLHQLRREPHAAQAQAEAAHALCTEQGFAAYAAWSLLPRGWAMVEQGAVAEGIAQMQQVLTGWRATGAGVAWPWFLTTLAEAWSKIGQREEGLRAVEEALAVVQRNEERLYEAEVYRLKGELLVQAASTQPEAEACFHQALDVARRQEAKALELRAAMSLAHLWQQHGQRQKAHDLLAPIYHWFSEGFDTADLQEAKALLDELA